MSDLEFVNDALRCVRLDLSEALCGLADDLDHGAELMPDRRLRARRLLDRYDRLRAIRTAIITGDPSWYSEGESSGAP